MLSCLENLGTSQYDIGFALTTETLGLLPSIDKTWYMSNTVATTCQAVLITSSSAAKVLLH